MLRAVRVLLLAGCAFACAAPALAQPAATSPVSRPAFEGYLGFTQAHDGSGFWTSEIDSGVQIELGHDLTFRSGAPLYVGRTVEASAVSETGATAKQRVTTFGDPYLGFTYVLRRDIFTYTATATGTIPVTDSHVGLSTGRVTFDQSNRFSHDVGPMEVFGEAGFGNSAMNSPVLGDGISRRAEPFVALGPEVHLRGGFDLGIGNYVWVSAAAYKVVPFGIQKLYRATVPGQQNDGIDSTERGSPKDNVQGRGGNYGGAENSAGQRTLINGKGRVVGLAQETTGTSSLTADYGFGTSLGINLRRRVELSFDYERSQRFAFNTASVTVGYRFGSLKLWRR